MKYMCMPQQKSWNVERDLTKTSYKSVRFSKYVQEVFRNNENAMQWKTIHVTLKKT